ncbi:hypothetical protein [Streptomyces sp. KR80]|uniref:hypothetical protein n=1 Tax=Streptomyces sp. KR80 TaxID=3457426 RepID=UPI003FD5E66A
MDRLRRQLKDAAASHRPDRERMLARVERGIAAPGHEQPPRRHVGPPSWLRVVGATAAVTGVLTAGGYAVASVVQGPGPARTATAPPSSAKPPAADPENQGSDAATGGPPTSSRGAPRTPDAPSPTRTAPPAQGIPPRGGRTEDGPLRSDGSVDPHSNEFWAQSTVTLKTTTPLDALTVELRIALTSGVSSAGAWSSLPAEDFTLTVDELDGFLVYRWRLKPGRTVATGRHLFAGQYDHERGARDASEDSYAADSRVGGERLRVEGNFAP